MATRTTTRQGVLARYPDGERAGRAIERLSLRGVEAGRISLMDGEQPPMDRPTQRATDAGTAGRLGSRFGRGLMIGGLLGAVIGALVLVWVASVTVGAAFAGALGGAVAGAGLGALTGLQSTPTMSRAWESTFTPKVVDEGTVVAVESDGPRALEEVEMILANTGALEIRRVADLDALEATDGELDY